jgi:hypothetical protein
MTPEEARKIALIVSTADGGCSICVNDLFKILQDVFPEHDWESLKDDEKEAMYKLGY